jgi:hypothetical protein
MNNLVDEDLLALKALHQGLENCGVLLFPQMSGEGGEIMRRFHFNDMKKILGV